MFWLKIIQPLGGWLLFLAKYDREVIIYVLTNRCAEFEVNILLCIFLGHG
jgi:hypothetical protein